MLSSVLASGRPGQVISFTYHCVIAQTEMYRSLIMNTRYSIFDDFICSSWKLHIIQVQVQFLQEETGKKKTKKIFFSSQYKFQFPSAERSSLLRHWGSDRILSFQKSITLLFLELVPITHVAMPEQEFSSVSSYLSYVCNLTVNLGCQNTKMLQLSDLRDGLLRNGSNRKLHSKQQLHPLTSAHHRRIKNEMNQETCVKCIMTFRNSEYYKSARQRGESR